MGEGEGGTIREKSTEACTLPYAKRIPSASSMHEAGHPTRVLWDNPEGGGGQRVGRGAQDGGTHVRPWLTHVDVQQKPLHTIK